MGTLIVGAILILIVGLIIRGIVRDKKSGKSSCGGDCSHCKGVPLRIRHITET
ncbi:MAG: FeoB-associated Cys-rich membrane protein [Blautia wexlerae]